MNEIIILLGQRVRSGTNFVGSTLSKHPDVVTVPLDKSLGEFNLFRGRGVELEFNKISESSFGMDLSNDDLSSYLKEYGKSWINFLRVKYNIPDHKTIFIKTCVIHNLDLWRMSFPEAKIAVIFRDGRDNVISSVRASYDKRSWHKLYIKFKKRINYYSGRSFINHTRHWIKTAKVLSQIQTSKQIQLFNYEELNNSKSNVKSLLEHYQLKVTESILEDCLNAPVIGSSFGFNTQGTIKPNWIPVTDKTAFQFSNKWKHWSVIKKLVFKFLAGNELVKLGYEKDSKW